MNHLFYRKFITLKNGQEVLLRFLNRADQESFSRMRGEISGYSGAIHFLGLKRGGGLPDRPENINYRRLLPLVALDLKAHRFIACASLHLNPDAARRVGQIHLSVTRPFRKLGLEALMLQELIDFALEEDLAWLQAEVNATQKKTIQLFRAHGFEVQAGPKEYYRSQEGMRQEALLLVRPLSF